MGAIGARKFGGANNLGGTGLSTNKGGLSKYGTKQMASLIDDETASQNDDTQSVGDVRLMGGAASEYDEDQSMYSLKIGGGDDYSDI